MSIYDVQRKVFNTILKKYDDYVSLYKFFNNGSTEGVASFEEFYWRISYTIKYDESQSMARSGY